MSVCEYTNKNGTICGRSCLPNSSRCHLKTHYDTEIEYKFAISQQIVEFQRSRITSTQFSPSNVEPDGACLFRSMANALFNISGNDLETLFKLIEKSKYYQMLPSEIKDGFLKDYCEIFECYSDPDAFLDQDIETEIAMILQKMVVKYAITNSQVDVSSRMEGLAEIFGPMCSLEMFIENTHEISLDEYITLYDKFAGEDDFYLEEKSVTIQKGRRKGRQLTKKVKVDIQERWGGLPELLMYADMFDLSFSVYIPQRLDQRSMKPVIAKKVCENTYYYLVQQINMLSAGNIVNLSLKEVKEGPHYEFLKLNAME
jgi:hypothetical protein